MTARGPVAAVTAVGLSVIMVLTAATVLRNAVWRDKVTLWSDVVAKNPDELNVYISLGNAYLDGGMLPEALAVFQYVRAREATTSIRIYPNIGNVYIAMKEYKQAEDLFSRVLMINADDELSYVGRGKARFAQGRYAEAGEDFQQALLRNPFQSRYYYYRGETYANLREPEKARLDIKRSCDMGWEEACGRLRELDAGESGPGRASSGKADGARKDPSLRSAMPQRNGRNR